MAVIRRLPPELSNQIAAGEVVERPASVVKELIENGLDAGAHRIIVTIELGGKKLMRVEDDGCGMDADDAELAFERHATSKIARADDLAAIQTLGFRGEALPSIASVSHLVLRTRPRGTPSGTEIKVNGGVTASVREVGMPEGTSVEVGDLFYNLPARRKFLKSDTAESTQVSRVVAQMALAYPAVGFTLVSGGRTLVQCPAANTRADRFFQLQGDRPDLIEIGRDVAGLRLAGYIAALAEQGPVRGPQNIFVNGRIVKDKTIAHAIIEAYSISSIKERSPEVHLFLELPPDRVDVNVHPTKAEVRFLDQSPVHEVLRRALADALGQGPAPQLQLKPPLPAGPAVISRVLPGVFGGPSAPHVPPTSAPQAAVDPDSGVGPEPFSDVAPTVGDDPLRPMVPLGQFRDTFIIAVDDEGIVIVDQHVAHERILFEQAMEKLTNGRLESQRLLAPLLLDFGPPQRQALLAHADDLDRFGFEIGEFGGDSVRVTAVPAVLGHDACATAVRALAADLEGFDRGSRVADGLRRIAATTACHAAVKANCPLSLEKMRYILEELRRTAYSSICPHGRPVVLRLTRCEIEKNFQRI